MPEPDQVIRCDRCPEPAWWLAFAAYPIASAGPHPTLARYPAAMVRACDRHLAEALAADYSLDNSTGAWLVTPCP